MGKLNDKTVQAAQAKNKQYNLSDGDGLTLVVKPTGAKLWWFRYRFAGTAKTLAIGQYPAVTLKEARTNTIEARKLLAVVRRVEGDITRDLRGALPPAVQSHLGAITKYDVRMIELQ